MVYSGQAKQDMIKPHLLTFIIKFNQRQNNDEPKTK